jgi:hypothetical protein
MAVWALWGCTAQPPELRSWERWRPHTADEATLRSAMGVPDLVLLHHDVALLCAPAPGHGAPCEAGRLDAEGLTSRGLGELAAAWSFDERRLLTLAPDLTLALQDGAERRVLARGALDPRPADDGRRVLYVQLEGEPQHFHPGDRGQLVVLDVESGARRLVTDDPLDSSPWLVPHSEDVLFTSARTGLASLWLATASGEVRQLTNVGLAEVGPDFVPVPSRELVWLPGTRTAVYSAHYGTHTLWSLDVDTGEALPLGPGRLPALHAQGGVLAVSDDPGVRPTLVHYAGGAL